MNGEQFSCPAPAAAGGSLRRRGPAVLCAPVPTGRLRRDGAKRRIYKIRNKNGQHEIVEEFKVIVSLKKELAAFLA